MPAVSFVMPIYGVEKYLKQCVDSVLAQTFTDFELILVDDGSPDRCGEICDEYAAKDARVKVIHKENGGVSNARNDGIRQASGEWAYIIDSDDWLEPDALENMYDAAMRTGADCVMSDVLVHSASRTKRGYLFSEPFFTDERKVIQDIQKFILCHKYSPHYTNKTLIGFAAPWSKLVRMSVVKRDEVCFDPYVKGRFDDGLWSLHMLDYARSVCYIDKVTYNYRIVGNSLTHAYKPQALDIIARGFERTEDFIRETGKDETFLKAHYGRVVGFLALQLSQYFFNPNNPNPAKEVKKELKRTIKSEPYHTAVRKCDKRYLESKHRFVALCARLNFIWGMKLYVKAKAMKRG